MAIPAEPLNRLETYLAKIAGETVTLPASPLNRIELYLAKIAGETVTLPASPLNRIELYLAKIAGETVTLPIEPLNRIEMYLAAWAGDVDFLPDAPLNRIEQYLAEIVGQHPTGYERLPYAASDGLLYCDTGYLSDSTTEFLCDFQFLETEAKAVGGCRVSSTNRNLSIGSASDGTFYASFGTGTNNRITVGVFDLDRHEIETTMYYRAFDGKKFYPATPTGTVSDTLPIYLFAMNNNGSASLFSKIRMFKSVIKDSSGYQRYMIPAKRTADSVIGMYDKITQTFYTPVGGSLAGPT